MLYNSEQLCKILNNNVEKKFAEILRHLTDHIQF